MCSAWFTMPVRIEPVSTSIRPTTSGLLGADELGDAAQHLAVAAQVAGARQRQVKRRSGAGGIADVVDEQAHLWGLNLAVAASKAVILSRRAQRVAASPRRSARARHRPAPAGAARAGMSPPGYRGVSVSPSAPLCETSADVASQSQSGCSSRTPGKPATTTCACSSTWRAHAISSTATTARRTGAARATKRRCARTCAGRSRRPRRSSRCRACSRRTRTCLTFQLLYAQASHKPVVLMKPFGARQEVPKTILRSRRRSGGMGRAGAGRCRAPPGASRGNDALGHDRVQTRLRLATPPRRTARVACGTRFQHAWPRAPDHAGRSAAVLRSASRRASRARSRAAPVRGRTSARRCTATSSA